MLFAYFKTIILIYKVLFIHNLDHLNMVDHHKNIKYIQLGTNRQFRPIYCVEYISD